ncbi:glycolate oxidase iron-sulfur subunit [Helicobacter cinaedi]|uniref:(Fe-S)-binding protein n=1 Tax=Helicobacter cinaedi TaxID=213 RepID=UPI001F21E79D|nr:(Fe-S)-binding protein [Helicobacter cinaedi]BDB65953.1 glycolate oxidase iron-sulfur subunit [Helicobacter cinaedi]
MLDLQSVASACVKCGKCIPNCTIYMANRDEVTSPRGFLDLLGAYKRGDLELNQQSREIFESCFLCTTCVTHCPSSLPVDVAIESVRVDIAEKYGIAWYKRVYFYLLRHRKAADFVFRFVHFIMPCAFKEENGRLVSRLKLFKGVDSKRANRSVFPVWRKSFLQKYQGEILPTAKSAPKNALQHNRVAIFIGCLSNYNYVSVGESLLEILNHLGIRAFVPHLQECCGAPAFFTGDVKSVVHLAKKNIDYFESFWDSIDAMIIPEATCAAMIKKDWLHALDSDSTLKDYAQRLEKLLPKIYMASEWLYHHTPLSEIIPQNLTRESITYHDPCHARKVLGVYKEPRVLLSKGFRLKEMSDSSRCCGFGGISMQSSRYDLTLKAGVPKAEMIEQSGAEIVSAECGACRMQIDNALTQIDSKVRFAHPLELIAQALKGESVK